LTGLIRWLKNIQITFLLFFYFQKYQSFKGKLPKALFLQTNFKNTSDIMPKNGLVFAKNKLFDDILVSKRMT